MEERRISVYRGSTKDYVPVPKITIQGQWLESLGFSIGDKLVVTCEQDRLTIQKREAKYDSEGIGMVAEPNVKYKERGKHANERHKPSVC